MFIYISKNLKETEELIEAGELLSKSLRLSASKSAEVQIRKGSYLNKGDSFQISAFNTTFGEPKFEPIICVKSEKASIKPEIGSEEVTLIDWTTKSLVVTIKGKTFEIRLLK